MNIQVIQGHEPMMYEAPMHYLSFFALAMSYLMVLYVDIIGSSITLSKKFQ
jgi:hypothetical protein